MGTTPPATCEVRANSGSCAPGRAAVPQYKFREGKRRHLCTPTRQFSGFLNWLLLEVTRGAVRNRSCLGPFLSGLIWWVCNGCLESACLTSFCRKFRGRIAFQSDFLKEQSTRSGQRTSA